MKTLQLIKESNAQWVDLRFTDTRGKEQHVTLPANRIDEEALKAGFPFDGSSIASWKDINESDMYLHPDDETPVVDPFTQEVTVNLRCNIFEPGADGVAYERDPRYVAQKAEQYLQSTGIGDIAYFGPEPEFFVFDNVRWNTINNETSYIVDSYEGTWNSGVEFEGNNLGHRPVIKGGYFPVPPVDSCYGLRTEICNAATAMGLTVELHHHEVASGGQNEIGIAFSTLTKKADEVQIFKYCVHNVADSVGKTATFMPKPLQGDNGSGMHVHQSITKDGKNIFSGNQYAGLSQEALYYIGGIIKHGRALNAFTNATTNSYKRLIPGFEAPVMLAYSARNRSAAIRIPAVSSPKAARIEARFPDAVSNPYLSFAALLLAGLDGIKNKIDPGKAAEQDLYALNDEQAAGIPKVCASLIEAFNALREDSEFLTAGGVFTQDMIDGYIALKTQEIERYLLTPHPVEFDMYYSL